MKRYEPFHVRYGSGTGCIWTWWDGVWSLQGVESDVIPDGQVESQDSTERAQEIGLGEPEVVKRATFQFGHAIAWARYRPELLYHAHQLAED